MKTLKTIAVAVVAATAATFTGSAATAGPRPEPAAPSIRVSYADLDLTRIEGRATLERRVGRAVTRLCGRPSVYDLGAMTEYRFCRKTASSSGREQLASLFARIDYASSGSVTVAVAQ